MPICRLEKKMVKCTNTIKSEGKLVKKIVLFLALSFSSLFANEVKCDIKDNSIYCFYFVDRSDNESGKEVSFYWHSPTGKDDRIKNFIMPPYHGSVFDYRFLPGREKGRWVVTVTEMDTNKSTKSSFDLNSSDNDIFED